MTPNNADQSTTDRPAPTWLRTVWRWAAIAVIVIWPALRLSSTARRTAEAAEVATCAPFQAWTVEQAAEAGQSDSVESDQQK